MKRSFFSFLALSALAFVPCSAQTTSRWTANIGGGFTQPVGNLDNRVDMGWNVKGGVGLNATNNLGLVAEFQYNQAGLSGSYLQQVSVPDGFARIWSISLNPVVRIHPHGRAGMYLIGGPGFYQRTVEFTQPTTAPVTGFDPWFGGFYNALVPANEVLGSFTQNKFGLNGGVGFTFGKADSNGKFFMEARYNYIFTERTPTRFIPVTFGYRW